MPHVFEGARLKVERARQQTAALERAFKRNEALFSFRVVSRYDATAGRHRLIAMTSARNERQLQAKLGRWGVIAGEVLHDLRSSLDVAVSTMHRNASASTPEKEWAFPITSARQDFKPTSKAIKGLSLEQIQLIEKWQPFHEPQGYHYSALGQLHHLNIRDKHRQLLQLDASPEMSVIGTNPVILDLDYEIDFKSPLHHGAEIGWMGAPPSTRMSGSTIVGGVMFSLPLAPDGQQSNRSVIPALRSYADIVDRVLSDLERVTDPRPYTQKPPP